MTFSVVAKCTETGMFGVAISSSSPAVAARCAYVRAGVGAASSQNVTDPRLGNQALDLMQRGATARQSVDILEASGKFMEYRQVLAVDQQGNAAIYSGTNSLGIFAEAKADNVASAGNLLANVNVPGAIVESFLDSSGHLGDRLISALQAGLATGGEAGPVQSAGLLIADAQPWPAVDLRCDWSGDMCPVDQVTRAWEIYKPQINDYISRALNPSAAPSYGVPGDE